MYGSDVNWTYCSDYFTVYTNIESLHYTTKINILYVKYINFLKADICIYKGRRKNLKDIQLNVNSD